jgi:formamidopyrimidine-DNA glycosylase
MPEIADLEAIRHYLMPRIEGLTVTEVETPIPWLVRTGADDLQTLKGHRFGEIHRLGKFLLFFLDDDRVMVVNAMLTGRFHWVEAGAKRPGRLGVVIGFDDGHEMRYSDMRRMGRWYLVTKDALHEVPQIPKLGPDAMAIDEEDFLDRFRKRRGQIKNVLTNQEVLAGIGNAYSDEILWEAQIHPHRKRVDMTDDDLRRLYTSMRTTIDRSTAIVDETVQAEGLGKKEEWREHLLVHRRADAPCPRCGSKIRGQTKGGSETNYCVTCQPLF